MTGIFELLLEAVARVGFVLLGYKVFLALLGLIPDEEKGESKK